MFVYRRVVVFSYELEFLNMLNLYLYFDVSLGSEENPFNFISYNKPYVYGKLLGSTTGIFVIIFRRWLEFLLAFYPPYNWIS